MAESKDEELISLQTVETLKREKSNAKAEFTRVKNQLLQLLEDLPSRNELKTQRVMIETPGKVGDTMVGGQISKVIETRNKDFPVGTIVRSQSGWRSHTIITSDQAHRMPELHDLPLSTALGVMGMPGFSRGITPS